MAVRSLPPAIGWDVLSAMGLGFAAGVLRLWLPRRGRGAFWADFIMTGLCLVFLQSFAVSFSRAGQLRWYMMAGVGLGALCAEHLFRGPAAGRGLVSTNKKTIQR